MMDLFMNMFEKCEKWIKKEVQYFSLPIKEQALFLERKGYYRIARKKYIQLENWSKVIEISKILKDYESVFYYYIKNKECEKALHTVELYELYELGAPFCEKQGLLNKAAHMYSYFDKIKAASLYKKLNLWDKAAECYMDLEQHFRALDCIDRLDNPEKRKRGYRFIEKQADTFFDKENYEQALKLYIRMQIWEKAISAAKILENDIIVQKIYEHLAHKALEEGYLLQAAQYLENIHIPKAIHLYQELGYIEEAAKLLVHEQKIEEAIHLLLQHHMVETAEKMIKTDEQAHIFINYLEKQKNINKLEELYDKYQLFEKAVIYFINQEKIELALKWIKKIENPYKAAQFLELIEKWEIAAHYYLLSNHIDLCSHCLKKAGFTAKEIQHFIQVKKYPDSFSS